MRTILWQKKIGDASLTGVPFSLDGPDFSGNYIPASSGLFSRLCLLR